MTAAAHAVEHRHVPDSCAFRMVRDRGCGGAQAHRLPYNDAEQMIEPAAGYD